MDNQLLDKTGILLENVVQKVFRIMEEQRFGEEKTERIRQELAQTGFFQWFDTLQQNKKATEQIKNLSNDTPNS
jgi:predicted amidohydrolase YtcJ